MRRRTISMLALLVLASCKEKSSESMTVEADSTSPAATTAEASAAASAVSPSAGQTCSYTTEAEVTEIVGHPMKFAEPPKPSECNLLSATGDTTKSVSFQIHDGTSSYDTMTAGPGFEPLSGVGEKAVLASATGMVLAVKNNRSYLGAVYVGTDVAQGKEKSLALARKIVPRM